ncbi:hypothetical protein ACFR99_03375 [Haloarchaeobius amylolyticus]|uniref:Ring-1,2-phenylacetyl-CoA epoxidase subunit PaaB n=1 Tax=Haloarchaeobius amylolyticus TaxID=1198296 RepID=A0ABD6BC11_9EURY
MDKHNDTTKTENRLEPYEVFVQWERGKAHEHAEVVSASDHDMALTLAKRNIDIRSEPVSVWVVPRREITTTQDDTELTPSTDRAYRNVGWYAQNTAGGSH